MKILFFLFAFSTPIFACKIPVEKKPDSIVKSISKSDSLVIGGNKTYININGEEKSWWSDWLPFLATLIVAYAAYRGVIKQSKASSVSGFRVNWIEDLRVNYSKFLIALRNVDNKIRLKLINPSKYSKDEDLEQVNFLRTKIKLMLNHSEPEHIVFWEALTQYMLNHNEYYKGEFSEEKENELDSSRVKMEELLLVIFKKEWDKAKNLG
jgi:hypothetical protein